jgi:hypothetical protein
MKSTIPAPKPVAARPQDRRPSMRSTVLLSLIVCPHGGVPRQRHGQSSPRP